MQPSKKNTKPDAKIFGSEATHPSTKAVQSNKQYSQMTKDQDVSILINGCRKKNQASQMALYKHFYSYGMAVSLRYSRSREEALEVLNDGFLKAFLKIEQYDTAQPFKPWLRKILINASIDHYRKYHRKQDKNEEKLVQMEAQASYNEALDNLAFEDLVNIMRELTPAYRMVFNLFVVDGRQHQEIAEELKISVGTSKSNLAKARNKIKSMLGASHGIYLKSKKYG